MNSSKTKIMPLNVKKKKTKNSLFQSLSNIDTKFKWDKIDWSFYKTIYKYKNIMKINITNF